MADYVFMPDGSVKSGAQEVAFFEPDGTIRDRRNGRPIGHVDDGGTVREASRNGRVLGVVTSDGSVHMGGAYGQVMEHVGPPVHKRGALALLLG